MTSQCSSLISVALKNTRAKVSRRGKGSLGPDLQLITEGFVVHHWGKPEQELSQGRSIKASLRLYPSVPLTWEFTHSQRSTAELWRMLLVGSQTPPSVGGVLLHQSPTDMPTSQSAFGEFLKWSCSQATQVVSSWQVNADHQDRVSGQQEPFPDHGNSGPHS